jgi:hypothetical protein
MNFLKLVMIVMAFLLCGSALADRDVPDEPNSVSFGSKNAQVRQYAAPSPAQTSEVPLVTSGEQNARTVDKVSDDTRNSQQGPAPMRPGTKSPY